MYMQCDICKANGQKKKKKNPGSGTWQSSMFAYAHGSVDPLHHEIDERRTEPQTANKHWSSNTMAGGRSEYKFEGSLVAEYLGGKVLLMLPKAWILLHRSHLFAGTVGIYLPISSPSPPPILLNSSREYLSLETTSATTSNPLHGSFLSFLMQVQLGNCS